MPLFDYKCAVCGYIIEDVLVTNSDVEVPCPSCNTVIASVDSMIYLSRQPTGANIRMKGFSALNGYSRTDTGWQPSTHKGIRTRVKDGGKGEPQ